jgi:hypothetical protein
MLAFCMMLVKEGVAEEVHLQMLICGHTHCDIDQVQCASMLSVAHPQPPLCADIQHTCQTLQNDCKLAAHIANPPTND